MYILLLIQQLLSSITHIISKNLTNTVPAPEILIIRASIAGFIYCIWILIKWKSLPKFRGKDILIIITLGALNIPVNQYLFFTGIKLSTAPNAALAYALSPAFVLIIALMSKQEKASLLRTIGIIVATIGTAIILFEHGIDFSSEYFIGNILVLTASFSWAVYTILGKDFSRRFGAINATALSMISGLILYTPIYIFQSNSITIRHITYTEFAEKLYLGVFTSVIAYSIWYYALSKTDASKVSVFNNIQPILTTILSVIFLSQHITALMITGGLLIIAGVFITQKG
jgi:drug/metabolite transporter (DMT)-like permease